MEKLPKFSRTNKIKKSSGIPTLSGKSEEGEAHFWDTHSPLDYPDEFTEVKEPLELTKLETLAAKEKGKEKPVTKKFINKLKNPPKFAHLVKKRVRENKELLKRLSSS